MPRSAPVDGFSLAYDRSGTGEPVLLLHGWPGDRTDYRILDPALALGSSCDVIVPDLRGSVNRTSSRPTRPPSTARRRRRAAWPG
ncbi:MAG TPA: alpha/beta hydrolase [Streptosporangiaceae bacterium]|nr:alpha/beta hydrolase [Streptosporangiaceae bacterium]